MTQGLKNRLANILMIEDSLPDIVLTREFLNKENIRINLITLRDGDEALDYLRLGSVNEPNTKPDLVLLDLNLPRVDGREVLQALQTDQQLRQIPVVILSGSDAVKDREETAQLGTLQYLTKPLTTDKLEMLVKTIQELSLEQTADETRLCWSLSSHNG